MRLKKNLAQGRGTGEARFGAYLFTIDMHRMPHVKTVMTPFPYSVPWESGVSAAVEMMEAHNIRHLPVTRDGAIFGVVADSDLRVSRALGIELAGHASRDDLQVGLVCSSEPYVVDLDAALTGVIDEMVRRQISSALVTREAQLCGILTTTDICRYLSQLLRDTFAPAPGDEAS